MYANSAHHNNGGIVLRERWILKSKLDFHPQNFRNAELLCGVFYMVIVPEQWDAIGTFRFDVCVDMRDERCARLTEPGAFTMTGALCQMKIGLILND